MTEMTGDIQKLPKWAQKHIDSLQRQRDIAVKRLEQFQNDQKKGPFCFRTFDTHKPGLEVIEKYFDALNMRINHAGVELDFHLRTECVEMTYSAESGDFDDVVAQPFCFQGVRFKLPRIRK